jgi:TDG/mug DNA glycosylase family protein
MTNRVHSFDPISDAASRVLILGSMPGNASLHAGQYYAHPQNVFWKILGVLLGFDPSTPYERRVEFLRANGIALWDVMQSCIRASSLDSDIEEASIVANPFCDFLKRHPQIHTVCFNGAKAEASWQKHVIETLPEDCKIAYHRLPSTSPANASIRYEHKFEAWKAALENR